MSPRINLKNFILLLIVIATAMVFGVLVSSRPQSTMYPIIKQRITGSDITIDNIVRLNFIEIPHITPTANEEKINTFNSYTKEIWLKDWITKVNEAENEIYQGVLEVRELDDTTYLLLETLAIQHPEHEKTILSHKLLLVDGYTLEIVPGIDYARHNEVSPQQIIESIQRYLDYYQQPNSFISIPTLTTDNLSSLSFYVKADILHLIVDTSLRLDDGTLMTAPQLHSIPLNY